jgi:hypothetical protein
MEATRRNLQFQPKILKKWPKFSQKKLCLVHSKCKGAKKLDFAGLTQNHKKIIETPNLPVKTKIFFKKTMFRILKIKSSQKLV